MTTEERQRLRQRLRERAARGGEPWGLAPVVELLDALDAAEARIAELEHDGSPCSKCGAFNDWTIPTLCYGGRPT